MARIGLKIFYLRTRVRQVSQQEMADELGIRQATISNIERGSSLPTTPLLLELSKYFDVTPTFLLDDERGILPNATERWSLRNALVTVGMWIEAPKATAIEIEDGKLLVPLLAGEAFYDDEACQGRRAESSRAARERALAQLDAERRSEEKALLRALQGELRAHPQRRGRRR